MRRVFIAIFSLIFIVKAFASSNVDPEVEKRIKQIPKKYNLNVEVISVGKSRIPCLYKVTLSNGDVVYVDKSGKYYIENINIIGGGSLKEQEKINLVEKLLNSKKIDLSKALKIGNGKYEIVEVLAPYCKECRDIEKYLSGREDITRYIFFIKPPFFEEKSQSLAIDVLCSDNPEEEFLTVMQGYLDRTKYLYFCKEGLKRLKEMEKEGRKLLIDIDEDEVFIPVIYLKTKAGWKYIPVEKLPEKLKNLK